MLFPILATLSAAGTGYSLLKNIFNKQESFADTEYGRKLKKLSERGIDISPIISNIGKETGNIAQQEKTALKGRLISQNMGGSIAGQRAISEIDTKRMAMLAKTLENLKAKNEQLKAQYALQYAQQGSQYDLTQQQSEQDALAELLSTSGSLLYEQLSPQRDYLQLLLAAMNRQPIEGLETFRPKFNNRMSSLPQRYYNP